MQIRVTIFATVAAVVIVGCSTKKNADAEEHKPSLKDASLAMESYHELMAQSFHPFMDSGNLEPAKAHAVELASAAARWTELGSIDQTDATIKSKLQQLTTNSRAFADLVRTGGNDTIGKSLENLHHEFHELMDLWSSEPKEHSSK